MKGRYALSILKEYKINVYYLMILVDFELSCWLKNYYLFLFLVLILFYKSTLKLILKEKKWHIYPHKF